MENRWAAWPGLWLGLGAWMYAALAVVELRGLGHDPTAPASPDAVAVAPSVPATVYTVAVVLGLALALAAWSRVTGRAPRASDALLGFAALAGAWLLWVVEQPRPVAPWAVGLAGVLGLAGSVLRLSAGGDRGRALVGRILLGLGGAALGWVSAVALADGRWQPTSWNAPYWTGLGVGAAMLLGAWAGSWRTRPISAWSWLAATVLLVPGLVLVVGGCFGFGEGYLISGHEESEDGWYLGGLPLFGGLGVLAAGVAACRARWPLVATSLGGGVLLMIGLLLGIDEVRRTLW